MSFRSILKPLFRFSISKKKVSRKIIEREVREFATNERTLVIHPEMDLKYFPNRFVVSKRKEDNPDLLVDSHFSDLSKIESESYPVIVCLGLLEHIPDPQRFVDELHRILIPGGRLFVRCSAVFSIHEGPDDYFHYTPFGLRRLFEKWARFEALRGTCGPFTTIGILLQRIHMQCDIFPLLRPLMELAFHIAPMFDRLVWRQYHNINRVESNRIDSMMPSNILAIVVK